jgi:hypothetical protein
MQLKRRTEIKPADLPYIESAYFAVSKLNRSRHDTFHRILNLDEMLRDGHGFSTSDRGQEDQRWKRLLSRVEHGDLLMVGDHSNPPFSPVFRKQARAEGAHYDTYEVHPHHGTNPSGLQGLLHYVGGSAAQRISSGATVAAGSTASAAAIAAAARSAVVDEKRYTLLVALAYKAQRLFLNRVAAVQCKLENEFTGPESRRSGAIKSSDPAYCDLRRRELREGDYTLALTRPPLAARKLKASRAKA